MLVRPWITPSSRLSTTWRMPQSMPICCTAPYLPGHVPPDGIPRRPARRRSPSAGVLGPDRRRRPGLRADRRGGPPRLRGLRMAPQPLPAHPRGSHRDALEEIGCRLQEINTTLLPVASAVDGGAKFLAVLSGRRSHPHRIDGVACRAVAGQVSGGQGGSWRTAQIPARSRPAMVSQQWEVPVMPTNRASMSAKKDNRTNAFSAYITYNKLVIPPAGHLGGLNAGSAVLPNTIQTRLNSSNGRRRAGGTLEAQVDRALSQVLRQPGGGTGTAVARAPEDLSITSLTRRRWHPAGHVPGSRRPCCARRALRPTDFLPHPGQPEPLSPFTQTPATRPVGTGPHRSQRAARRVRLHPAAAPPAAGPRSCSVPCWAELRA